MNYDGILNFMYERKVESELPMNGISSRRHIRPSIHPNILSQRWKSPMATFLVYLRCLILSFISKVEKQC